MENLHKKAGDVERLTFYPKGITTDGCPYSANYNNQDVLDVLTEAIEVEDTLKRKIRQAKKNNPQANENCANWKLWAFLDYLGVARIPLGWMGEELSQNSY